MSKFEIIASLVILILAIALFVWGFVTKGSGGISYSGSKVFSVTRNYLSGFLRRIWNSRYRWLWIGIGAFLLFSLGRSAYVDFFTDEGLKIKTATAIVSKEGQEFVFELPDGLKRKRVELLNGIEVTSTPGTLVGFKFPNGKLYEYSLAGQRTISRTVKKLSGTPLHRENDLEFLEYKGYKARKKRVVLFKGSELEWSKPPYVLIAKSKHNEMPIKISSRALKYRVVDQEVFEPN